jgi:hypothetical protein
MQLLWKIGYVEEDRITIFLNLDLQALFSICAVASSGGKSVIPKQVDF